MESLSFKIAQSIAASLANAIREHGQASLVVSGGSSPLEIFAHLSLATISWDHVTIILGDDRLVHSKHKDSNELLIMRHLLINHAKASQYLSLTDSSLDAPQLKSPFDVVLLGMGLDGHFASLFPDLLDQEHRLFDADAPHEIYISEIPLGDPPHRRKTMSTSMLLNTQRCILLVPNSAKRQVLDQAHADSHFPLYYLLNQSRLQIECSDTHF